MEKRTMTEMTDVTVTELNDIEGGDLLINPPPSCHLPPPWTPGPGDPIDPIYLL
jgi:hypothetical protein